MRTPPSEAWTQPISLGLSHRRTMYHLLSCSPLLLRAQCSVLSSPAASCYCPLPLLVVQMVVRGFRYRTTQERVGVSRSYSVQCTEYDVSSLPSNTFFSLLDLILVVLVVFVFLYQAASQGRFHLSPLSPTSLLHTLRDNNKIRKVETPHAMPANRVINQNAAWLVEYRSC